MISRFNTMKAILEFELPADAEDHAYALAGLDALLAIDDTLNEIRSAIRYNSGRLKECDIQTLEILQGFIIERKIERKLPELV